MYVELYIYHMYIVIYISIVVACCSQQCMIAGCVQSTGRVTARSVEDLENSQLLWIRNGLSWIAPHSATGWGPKDSVQLRYKWLNSMVYSRYNMI